MKRPGRRNSGLSPWMPGSVLRNRLVAISLTGLVASAIAPISLAQQTQALPPPAVVVEPVEVKEVSTPARFTARVEAIETVDIRARVSGFLQRQAFKDGQAVKAGDTLFEIQPDELDALLASAEAQVARAKATQQSAERTLARTLELFARKTVSQAVLDEAQAAFDVATADVQVAEAALRTAELNRSYATIAAPISGSIGRATFTTGNLVGPDSGSLARIVSLDPVRVAFALSETLLVTIRQQEAAGGGIDPNALKLSLNLANGTDHDEPGRIEFIDDEVDPQTGTVTARAVFANPHHILIPGQFVTVSIEEEKPASLPVVPQTAVLQDRDGRFVYLLGSDNTVSQRRIETGARFGNGWAVAGGLSGGEQVVVQGVQRLADGMTVQPAARQPGGT
jgi:membrane fusion protein, multidrug efflux system